MLGGDTFRCPRDRGWVLTAEAVSGEVYQSDEAGQRGCERDDPAGGVDVRGAGLRVAGELFGALPQVGDDGTRATALDSTWVSPRLARQAPECVPALGASEDVDAVVLEFGHADDLQPGEQVGQLVAADDRRPPRCRCPGVADAEEGGAEQAPRGESAGNAGDEHPQVVGSEQV
jgi:hypothetical protein